MEIRTDLSIFKKFDFEFKPVGVQFLLIKPEGIAPLDRPLAFCEMLKAAQTSAPFYAAKDHHECKAGALLLGMADPDPIFESGQIGPRLGIFEDARANRNVYRDLHRMERNSVHYVVFASLDKLVFEPDLLIVTAKPSQAEILLRAHGYRTGAAWNAKGSSVIGCAYLYLYPYATGELNMMVTGLHHGMKVRQTFPEGLLLITIPYHRIPEIVDSLKSMQWDLPQYSWGKETHLKRMKAIAEEVMEESGK